MGKKILRFHFEHSHRCLHHFLAQALLLCLAFFPAQVFLFIEFFNITDSFTHSMISTPELFFSETPLLGAATLDDGHPHDGF